MQVIGWKVWYQDKVITSKDMPWAKLPDGIQVVILYYDQFISKDSKDRYRKVCDGCDWYWFDGADINPIPIGNTYSPRSIDRDGEWIPKPDWVGPGLLKRGDYITALTKDLSLHGFKQIADVSMKDLIFNG